MLNGKHTGQHGMEKQNYFSKNRADAAADAFTKRFFPYSFVLFRQLNIK
jgi:hypothetical protein